MNAAQRRRQALIEDLIRVCEERGLGPEHLAPLIYNTCIGKSRDLHVTPDPEVKTKMAEKVSAAGLAAQLNFLLDVLAERRLRAELMKMGGVLDAIVRQTSSSRAELDDDIGRNNVDVNGDVV